MARPLFNKDNILARQDGIQVLMRPENTDFVSKVMMLLRKIFDMPKLVLRIKKVAASHKEWCKLITAMGASLHLFEEISLFYNHAIHDLDKRFILDLIQAEDIKIISNAYATLNEAIDIENSLSTGDMVFAQGFSAQLDEMTELYDNLETHLTEAAKSILQVVPLLNQVAVEYVPQVGYLAAIDSTDADFLSAEDFKLVYEMGSRGFFKCNACYQLDDQLGDIKGNIADLKKNITLSLEEVLLEAESSIVGVSLSIGALDATLSLALVAIEMNFVRPDISQDSVLIIKNGRHPLSQLAVDTFVPNDSYLTADMNVALITGYVCEIFIYRSIHLVVLTIL